jgi:hypothetical protein
VVAPHGCAEREAPSPQKKEAAKRVRWQYVGETSPTPTPIGKARGIVRRIAGCGRQRYEQRRITGQHHVAGDRGSATSQSGATWPAIGAAGPIVANRGGAAGPIVAWLIVAWWPIVAWPILA